MSKDYFFFRGYLDRDMAIDGDPGLFAATEVVQAVCDADFQKNRFIMMRHSSSPHCYYKFAKPPKDGMYMLRAVKKESMTTLDILIDTRVCPCFVWIENNVDWQEETEEIRNTLEQSFNEKTDKLKWHVHIREYKANRTQHICEFISALEYMNRPFNLSSMNNSNVNIGQLILEVKGDNHFNGDMNNEEPLNASEDLQLVDSNIVQKMKPLFYNNEDDVKQFLKEIESMSPNCITDLVNQWVRDKRISDYGNSRKGDLWKILHEAKLYSRTIQNWNRRVF